MYHPRRAFATSIASLLSIAAPSALAGGVRIVDTVGDRNFDTIQEAVDAAVDGEVVLVGAGTYPGFTIDGKGIAIEGPREVRAQIQGGIRVSNLPEGSHVVLSQLEVRSTGSESPIHASACAGSVRVQGCVAIGGLGAGAGIFLEACEDVSIRQSTAVGAASYHIGAPGLRAVDSRFALHECTLDGGPGLEGFESAGDGGPGCESSGAGWFVAGKSFFRGGTGEGNCETDELGLGGSGLVLSHPAVAQACTFDGAYHDPCFGRGVGQAPDVVGGSFLQLLPGQVRTVASPGVAAAKGELPLVVGGEPGDEVYVLEGPTPDFETSLGLGGAWLIGEHLLGQARPLGVVDGSWSLAASLPVPGLPQDVAARELFLQVLVRRAAGGLQIGAPAHVLVLNPASGPDCDQDGQQDYLATYTGAVPDVDQNLVPDTCP